jgi:hypothetical protein
MRPSGSDSEIDLYECTDCGKRVENPDSQMCDACGGEFINLSRARDL